ncbi:MAG: hypothetical protein JWP81_1686 [Ferruginibacter sp.]|nr:hypothetical protein [Ferruginibacter sp.]
MENNFKSFITVILMFCAINVSAQKTAYKSFSLSPKGDTLNAIDTKGMKQGKWVITVGELRGEPGYEEEGFYKNDKKDGTWRRYNTTGDILAIENYRFGGKDGQQEYFSFLGDLLRHEEWHAYNPDQPFDTIPIYGTGSNEIISFKIVRSQQYSVPHGEWKYYEPGGRQSKYEKYDRGLLLKDKQEDDIAAATATTKEVEDAPPGKPKVKTKEILEYEKKYSKKKRKKLERDGQTGL